MVERKSILFFANGEQNTVNTDDITPETTLNTYLRSKSYLTGTKRMCGEGGCGVCTVAIEEIVDGKTRVFAVNSCLVSIYSCHDWKIYTIEGIGNPLKKYHPIQKLLADYNGTQCGFCSPGMVMNMYALNESNQNSKEEIENSFGGNICRCTGYRPILTAFKQLASNSDSKLADIEDLKLCPKNSGQICTNSCQKMQVFFLNSKDSKWIKVHTLKDLLEILRIQATTDYILVCGNTARGVFKDTPTPSTYIDVRDVRELTEFTMNDDTLTLGANITLTQLMDISNKYSSRPNFLFLKTIAEHIDLVASVQVRNIGSIAGNLMMKHHHNEFQSDVFLLLETFKATIFTVDVDGNETISSPREFLKLNMSKKVIKTVVLSHLDSSYKYATYKIMPRGQFAHAMLNAGFLVKITNNLVTSASIVYGSVNPSFIHATTTENLLVGKNLYNNETLQAVFNSLYTEVVPDYVLPDPSPAFRKNLAVALFYKFVIKTCPSELVGNRYKSGGNLLVRPISTGAQEYETIEKNWPLTKPIPKLESLAQTSGQAKYIMDTPSLPNEVYAVFVTARAPPGSTVASINTSEALKVDGVIAYYDKNDIPGVNTFTPKDVGLFPVQEELFCSGTVQYYYQPIGIIVANNEGQAAMAADLVKIIYNPPKDKFYLNVKDVVADNVKSRITHQTTILPKSRGKDVKKTISGEFFLGLQYHFHMELQCCKVVPTEDGLDIFPSSQWMDSVQLAAAAVLGISSNKINVQVRRLGGGFGGKMFRNALISSAASLAAYKLQVPVTISLSLEENMNIIGKRHPLYMKYEVEVNAEGIIQYLNANLYVDHGVGGNESTDGLLLTGFENGYDMSHWDFSTYTVKTDTHANCFTRAPGTMEGLAAIESIMEHIAATLNLDSMSVKLANMSPDVPQLSKYWSDLKTWADIDQRKQKIAQFNKENRWMKQGIAVVPMKWILEVPGNFSVIVSIFHGDGGVAVSHGGIEIGQGINTKVAQVCAYKFGIDMDKVSITPSYSFVSPNSTATGGSMTTESVCYAVIKACDTILSRIEPVRQKMKNPTWVELIKRCYDAQIQLTAPGFYWGEAPGIQEYPVYGICAASVEVDILTGKQQILQFDVIEDLGESMNPFIDIGQIEGAIVMGIGFYTTEEIIFDTEGKLLTNRTWNYKPPGAKDIPINFRIKFAANSQNPVGVLRSKGEY